MITRGNRVIGPGIVRCQVEAGARVAINYVEQPEDALKFSEALTRVRGQTLACAIQANISDETCQALGGLIDLL